MRAVAQFRRSIRSRQTWVSSTGETSFCWMRGAHSAEGICYNKQADERSWQAMPAFFDEIFV